MIFWLVFTYLVGLASGFLAFLGFLYWVMRDPSRMMKLLSKFGAFDMGNMMNMMMGQDDE